MPRSAPGTIATVFVNSHRLVIDSLRNLKENRKIFKEKSHPCGGSFYVKILQTRMKWGFLEILTINLLY